MRSAKASFAGKHKETDGEKPSEAPPRVGYICILRGGRKLSHGEQWSSGLDGGINYSVGLNERLLSVFLRESERERREVEGLSRNKIMRKRRRDRKEVARATLFSNTNYDNNFFAQLIEYNTGLSDSKRNFSFEDFFAEKLKFWWIF